jgi:hypothetical protein
MKKLTKQTLIRISEELPTFPLSEGELEELVAPRYGIITGYQDILREIERMQSVDLADIGPDAGLAEEGRHGNR